MKSRKIAAVLIAVTLLFSGVSAAVTIPPSQNVHAEIFHGYKYDKHFYYVVITKPTRVYRIHYGKYMYKNRYKRAYTLKPGDTTWIRNKGDIDWGWTIGKRYHYCSFRDSENTSWFNSYSKYNYIDKSIMDNKVKEEHKSYKFNWREYRQLVRYGFWTKPYRKWIKPAKRLIKRDHIRIVNF